MNPLAHDQRVEALRRLEAISEYPQARMRMEAIDRLLVIPEDFCDSDVRRILGKREHRIQIQRALELYVMMARVMKLCEPKGRAIGPACVVRQIKFEELTYAEALDLKNGIGFRLAFRLSSSLDESSSFSGLDLLNAKEQELYERLKPCFTPRAKPTLKLLAARLLRDSEDRTFSDRAIIRYIAELNRYSFNDQNHRRDYLINLVNSFGAHNKSARESARYAMAQAAVQIGPIIREQMLPMMAQAAQLVAQTLPRIPEILPQLGESIVLMRETLQHVRQSLPLISHSVAQIPVVLLQLQSAVADLGRTLPQALSAFANLNLNLRQN